MKKFFGFLNDYVIEFDWKDLGVFKVCLCAFGIMLGLSVPKEKKKPVLLVSAVLFAVTTIVIFARLFGMECPFCCEDDEFDEFEDEDDGFVMRISSEE